MDHLYYVCTYGNRVRITTILYQTAYEEIPKIRMELLLESRNSLRQLTACIAIALVSTLSTHYSDIAVYHTKAELVHEINQSDVLNQI